VGKQTEYKQLSREELNALAGEELPERAAMSLINANVAAPSTVTTPSPTTDTTGMTTTAPTTTGP
jgi:hypothetical protein